MGNCNIVTITISVVDCYYADVTPAACAKLLGLDQHDVECEYITLEERDEAEYADYRAAFADEDWHHFCQQQPKANVDEDIPF